MKIKLTQGQFAEIDEADYPLIAVHSWQARPRRDGRGFYAVNSTGVRMHRLLLGVWDDRIVDHIDGDGLNNQRANIRVGTQSQNCVNRKQTPGPFMRGVYRKGRKFRSRIKVKGRMVSLGYFDTEAEAHAAFVAKSTELHGDWRPLPPAPAPEETK
jgi:hypothetical protein